MATVANPYNPNEEQEENQGAGGQILSSAPDSSGGGGSAPSSSGGGGQTAPRAPLTGAPNIQQYLQANEGAGQKLAGGIQSNVQNQAKQVGQNVNTAQSQLNKQYQPLQQNLQQGQQTIQTAFQNPQALLDAYTASKTQSSSQPLNNQQQQDLQQYNQFQQYNTGGYNPGISQYGSTAQQAGANLQQQAANLQQQAGSAATESGRFGLLQKAVGQPNYNAGQQTLDALFLQAQPGVANQLKQNLGNIAQQTGQQVGNLNSDAQSKLAALQGLSAQNQDLIKNQFGNEIGNIGQSVKQRYDQLAETAPQQQEAFQHAFETNQFSPEQLAALGLDEGQQTWGLEGKDFKDISGFQANPLAAFEQGGAAKVANPEEFARYNALNQLAGGPNGLQKNIFGASTEASSYDPYNLVKGKEAVSDAIKKQAELQGITKVNNFIDQMRNSGYFQGQSAGGGLRANDPGASRRVSTGEALTNLQNTSKGASPTADPNSYYQQAIDAINNSWSGFGVNPFEQGVYNQLQNYGQTFNDLKGKKVSGPKSDT